MTASNRAIVDRSFHDGLNKRDLSVLKELYSDCTYHLPLVGELRGEALTQFFAIVLTAFPDAKRTVDDQFTDDVNNVVTRWTATATHRAQFIGVALQVSGLLSLVSPLIALLADRSLRSGSSGILLACCSS